ncbi:MAG: hypothetical protein ACPG6B_08555 [Oceanihabitans sp.]
MKIIRICLLVCILLTACDRNSCTNSNPIFNSFNYSDLEYKQELAKKIDQIGMQNLRTWLADYIEKGDNTYLVFYIQNESLCAKLMLKMNHWNNLESLKNNKGKGYFNAEFKGLSFLVEKNKNNTLDFVYKSYTNILD